MFATMVPSSPIVMVMAVLSMQEHHLGVEDTTMMSSTLRLCAALVMVAIAMASKKKTMEKEKKKTMEKEKKKKTMEKRNKMTPLNALT